MIYNKNLIILFVSGFIFFNNISCMQDYYVGENISPEEAMRIECERQGNLISNITNPENIFICNPFFIVSQINTFISSLLDILDIASTESLNLSYSSVTENQIQAVLDKFKNLKKLNVMGCNNLSYNFIRALRNTNLEILIFDKDLIIKNLTKERSFCEFNPDEYFEKLDCC